MKQNILEFEDVYYEQLDDNNKYLLENFDCTNKHLNEFLMQRSHQYAIEHKGTTYLVLADTLTTKVLIGYFTLRCTSLLYSYTDNKGLRGLPAVEISNFALNKQFHGKQYRSTKLSTWVLSLAGYIIKEYSEYISTMFILLYAVPEAYNFYHDEGFDKFKDIMIPLFYREDENCIPMYERIE